MSYYHIINLIFLCVKTGKADWERVVFITNAHFWAKNMHISPKIIHDGKIIFIRAVLLGGLLALLETLK